MKNLILTFLLAMFTLGIQGQKPPKCATAMAPTAGCSAACIHCSLDGYTSETNHLDVGGTAPPGYCTFIVHHIQYVGFVAGSTNLTISVSMGACSRGNSIELGIYKTDNCGDFELVSNCHTAMFTPGVYNFTNTVPLDIGCPYYLVIDGNGPASCQFSVRVLAGSTTPPPVLFNGPIMGPDHVCQGEEHMYTVRHNGACYKMWTVTNGTIVGPDDEDETTIAFNTPGIAKICFTGENLCSAAQEICKDVIVHPNPIEVFMGPFQVCEGKTYIFDGRPYPGGEHEIEYTARFGCDSIIILEVEEVEKHVERIEVSRCHPDCYIRGGQQVCAPGLNRIVIQSKTPPFCDSVFNILFNPIRIAATVTVSGNLSCGDTVVTLSADSSLIAGQGRVDYIWTNDFAEEIGDQKTVDVTKPGTYCLELRVTGRDGYECSETKCTQVIQIIDDPELALDSSLFYCLDDTLFLDRIPVYEVNGYRGNITFHTGPPSPINQIQGYVIIGDSIRLWAQFSAGECSDTLVLVVRGRPTPRILVRDTLTFCEGDTIDLMDIRVMYLNSHRGTLSYHSRKSDPDTSQLKRRRIFLRGERLFIRSRINRCRHTVEVPLDLLPYPEVDFTLDRDTICLGDTVRVAYTSMIQADHVYKWNWDGAQTSPIQNQEYDVTFPASGVYKISLIVDNQYCESGPEEKTVVVEQPLDDLQLICEQSDSIIIFSWKKVVGATRYEVIKNTGLGQGSRLNDTSYRVNQLANRDSVSITVIVYGPESCGPVMRTIQCRAVYCPPKDMVIDDPGYICLTPNSPPFNLSVMVQGGLGQGQLTWLGTGIIDPQNGVFDPKIAGLGMHFIECILGEQDCEWRTGLVIDIRPTPDASFMMDSVICQDSTAELIYLGGFTGANAAWNYDGGFALPGANTFDQLITWSEPGEKLVQLILEENGCESLPFIHQIRVEPRPDSLQLDCEVTRQTVKIIIINYHTGLNVDIVSISGQIPQKIGDDEYLFDGLMPGEEVIVEMISFSENSCTDIVQSFRCMTDQCPNLVFDLSDDIYICSESTDSIFIIPYDLPGSNQSGVYSWDGPGLNNSDQPVIDLRSLGIGTYKYFVSYAEDGCDYRDSIQLHINNAPEVIVAESGQLTCSDSLVIIGPINHATHEISWSSPMVQNLGDTAVVSEEGTYIITVRDVISGCLFSDTVVVDRIPGIESAVANVVPVGCDSTSDLGSLTIENIDGGIPPYEFEINGGGFQNQNQFDQLPEGNYSVIVRDANGCTWSEIVNIQRVNPIIVDLGSDLEVYEGTVVTIDAVTNVTPKIVRWSPEFERCDNCTRIQFIPDSNMTIRVEVIDENGCSDISEVSITVKYKRIFVPNSFSPNGDNINDILQIFSNDEVAMIISFEIFDRWGEMVFSEQNADPRSQDVGWKGDLNGEILNPAVFVYRIVVEYKDESQEAFIGNVTLVR